VSVDALRREPAARVPFVDRVAVRALERVLPRLEGGTLLVRLPDGAEMSFGSGPAVRMAIDDPRFFRRLATGPRFGLGESYQAGEWRSDDLPGLLELLIRNA